MAATITITILVSILVGFILQSVLHRNIIVVQPERNTEARGCLYMIGFLIFIALILGGVALFWRYTAPTESERPPQQVKKSKTQQPKSQETPSENEPQPPSPYQHPSLPEPKFNEEDSGQEKMLQPPHINKAPLSFPKSTSTLPIVNEPPRRLNNSLKPTPKEAYLPENTLKKLPPPIEDNSIRWILLVKRFDNKKEALALKNHFSAWKMRVREVNGEFWNIVLTESKTEGERKIRAWNKYRADFDHMNLELKPMRARITYDNPAN